MNYKIVYPILTIKAFGEEISVYDTHLLAWVIVFEFGIILGMLMKVYLL